MFSKDPRTALDNAPADDWKPAPSNQAGSVFHESRNTAHEWQSWRRSLHELAPLLFNS
jgi:hypothetical protein